MQDEDVDRLEPAKRLDGRGAGVAGGGADHGGAGAVARSARFISRATTCMARSLKASVGPWNNSSMKRAGRDLPEWRDGRMMEAGIGLGKHALELGEARVPFEKGAS